MDGWMAFGVVANAATYLRFHVLVYSYRTDGFVLMCKFRFDNFFTLMNN